MERHIIVMHRHYLRTSIRCEFSENIRPELCEQPILCQRTWRCHFSTFDTVTIGPNGGNYRERGSTIVDTSFNEYELACVRSYDRTWVMIPTHHQK